MADNPDRDASRALMREALKMAVEHHGNNAKHPTSKGPAGPKVVTATAREFYLFLNETVERAGVELPE